MTAVLWGLCVGWTLEKIHSPPLTTFLFFSHGWFRHKNACKVCTVCAVCIIFLEIQQFIVHKICNDAAGKEHSHQIFTLFSAYPVFILSNWFTVENYCKSLLAARGWFFIFTIILFQFLRDYASRLWCTHEQPEEGFKNIAIKPKLNSKKQYFLLANILPCRFILMHTLLAGWHGIYF